MGQSSSTQCCHYVLHRQPDFVTVWSKSCFFAASINVCLSSALFFLVCFARTCLHDGYSSVCVVKAPLTLILPTHVCTLQDQLPQLFWGHTETGCTCISKVCQKLVDTSHWTVNVGVPDAQYSVLAKKNQCWVLPTRCTSSTSPLFSHANFMQSSPLSSWYSQLLLQSW